MSTENTEQAGERTQDEQLRDMIIDAAERVSRRAAELASCGAIDRAEPYFNKAILCAALRDVSNDYKPFMPEGKAAVKNLEHF